MNRETFYDEWNNGKTWVEVQTSGSTGSPKVMRVLKSRMEASARMTITFLGLREGMTLVNCLPEKYIAGKMMIVRSVVGKMKLIQIEPSGNPLRAIDTASHIHMIALTPMQVYNILNDKEQRVLFEAIDNIIIGGGAVDEEMENELRKMHNNIWSTYAMTETLSHIAMRRLSGPKATLWYKPLEGVEISLSERGCLQIEAPHLVDGILETNDIAEIRDDGSFRIIGRIDNVICSGGIKLQVEELEARLHREVKHGSYAMTWKSDRRLGQALIIAYEGDEHLAEELKQASENHLGQYERPKDYVMVSRIPTTETGKIARSMLHEMVEKL
ncbi:MAG: AMP-binding protein [Marinilabiliaceae bacterium]|nr:AMP-binding protein [Marinilabiliaceae bacterium]